MAQGISAAHWAGVASAKLKQTVVRAGYGMNYTVGEYATFANTMAHQPPFTNQQTNQEAVGTQHLQHARGQATCFTLANGFPAPATLGNYALDSHYPLPYLQAWNIDIQKSLPWGSSMNLGYNGSRGNHLDTVIAPRAIPSSPDTDPSQRLRGTVGCLPLNFRYEEAVSFSKFNAGTVRVNKRLSQGISLGANYQYSHSIDDAGALGNVGGLSAQDWQNLLGELGNSGLDVRHRVSGTYLYELPFGKDKFWVTSGVGSHILEGFSVSGSFTVCHRRMAQSELSLRRLQAPRAARAGCCGLILPAFPSQPGAGRCTSGSTRRLTRRQRIHPATATSLAMRRATRFWGRERCRTICRSRRQWAWATRAAWRFARRSITSSTRCSTRGWGRR